MTIYCPSCGKPNTDQAETCASCGADLAQAKAKATGPKKFKGTMMMGAAGAKPPTPEAPASPATPAAPATPAPGGLGGSEPSAEAPAAPAGASGGKAGPEKKNLAFQATMLGSAMAPPPGPPPGGAASAPGQPRIPGPPPPAAGPPGSPPPADAGGASGAGEAPAATAPTGLGAPPEPAAAGPMPGGSGFGPGTDAPPSATPSTPADPGAGAGWGSPSASPPPAAAPGGWGGTPAQVSTASGTPAPTTGGLDGNKKILIGVAAGCLGLVMLTCIAGGVGLYFLRDTSQQAAQAATSFAAQASRVSLGFTLSGIQMSCQGGGPEAAAAFFHPDAFSQLADEACAIDNRAIDIFGDAEKSTVEVLARTGMADRATSLGLDPEACFLYEADGAKVVGCALEDGFKIVHLENVGSL